jgi:GntR family transcriptional regulator
MVNEFDEETNIWPVQEQIAAYLRDGILSGEFPPGSKLPSSRALYEKFGAAAQTIRNAIMILERERLAFTKRGSGVIVRPHRQRTMEPAKYKEPAEPGEKYRWLTEAEDKGVTPSIKLLDVEEVVAPAAVREAFDLSEGGTALLRRQVLSLGDEVCELVESYYPMDLARGTALMHHKKIKGGTPRLLADMGFPPVRCVDKLSARWPTPEQYRALKMPTKLPVLRAFRVVYSSDDRPIEATIMAKAGHLYEMQYEF